MTSRLRSYGRTRKGIKHESAFSYSFKILKIRLALFLIALRLLFALELRKERFILKNDRKINFSYEFLRSNNSQ